MKFRNSSVFQGPIPAVSNKAPNSLSEKQQQQLNSNSSLSEKQQQLYHADSILRFLTDAINSTSNANPSNVNPDDGSSYGDIVDSVSLEVEETLERIDAAALKAFPAAFGTFAVSFWVGFYAFVEDY